MTRKGLRSFPGWALAVLLFLQGGSHAQGFYAGGTPAEADRAAREIHEKGGYPSTLPRAGPKNATPPSPGASRPPGRRKGKETKPSRPWGESSLGALLAAFLGGGLLALLVFLLLRDRAGGAVSRPGGGKESKGAPGGEIAASPAGGEEGDLSGDPDVFAERGEYGRAVAALLGRALEKTGWSRTGPGRSLTAREILEGLSGDDPRRKVLAAILGPAEAVRFGGRPATARLYGELRARFRELSGPVEAGESAPPGRRGT